jgi:arsenate reductase (thioredoxin)
MLPNGTFVPSHFHVDEYLHIPFDLVFTVCDHASEQCPVFPGAVKRIHHNFPDPAKARGTKEEVMNAFRSVRDEIKSFCKTLI